MKLVLNGRFLARPPTGVDRVAEQVILALDKHLACDPFGEVVLATPKNIVRQLDLQHVRHAPIGPLGGAAWEQLTLPAHFPSAVIVNLCNVAPAVHSRNIVVIHDTLVFDQPRSYSTPFRTWYRLLIPLLGRRAEVVITVSHHAASRLKHHGVLGAHEPIVIHNGTDHLQAAVADASASPDKPTVLFVGTPAPHKNLALALELAKNFETSAEFVIVGATDRRVYGGAAADISQPNVRFAGRVSDSALAQLYASAACLIFPSFDEGFGLPPLEAMRMGCPVVSSNRPPMPELLGEGALYAAPDNLEGWNKAVACLLYDDAQRQRLIEAGRRQADIYRWSAAGGAYAAIFKKALGVAPVG